MPIVKRTYRSIVMAATAALILQLPLAKPAESPTDYASVADSRAEKIVATLNLPEIGKSEAVRALISRQYQALHSVHAVRDEAIAAAKAEKGGSDAAVAAAKSAAEEKIATLHRDYLEKLAALLTPAQVDGVKDGMTYGVLPNTYRVYMEMMPDLTEEQKTQIMTWLKEAREHAMDAGSADEKHAWFGKYKGRINNYLSKAGIDMKAAEKNLKRKP